MGDKKGLAVVLSSSQTDDVQKASEFLEQHGCSSTMGSIPALTLRLLHSAHLRKTLSVALTPRGSPLLRVDSIESDTPEPGTDEIVIQLSASLRGELFRIFS